jgi:hypothetical protein
MIIIMVSSVSPQAQQSIPAANTFQPGGNESAKIQAALSVNNDRSYRLDVAPKSDDSSKVSASSSRGTQLDITA